jgi:hypothetical protein
VKRILVRRTTRNMRKNAHSLHENDHELSIRRRLPPGGELFDAQPTREERPAQKKKKKKKKKRD